MTWKSSNSANSLKSGRVSSLRHGPESSLQRLIRLVAEEGGVHAFIHRATADQGVVEEARALTRMLLGGQDISAPCRQLCQRHGVGESLLRTRLWAVASLFPDQQSATASPYEILGVEPWTEQDAIKRAYRVLCLKWHPDHNQDDPDAVTRFRQIKAAYDMVNDPATAQGWGPPTGVNVWEEPGPCEEKRPWKRLRRLAPLALVVGLLVLVVGFADLLVHYPRPKSMPRDTSRNEKTLPDPKLPVLEGSARQDVREPQVLSLPPSGQNGFVTVVQSAPQAPGGPENFSDAHVNVSQDSLSGLAAEKVRQNVVASEAGRSANPNGVVSVADFKAAEKGVRVVNPVGKAGPALAPASAPAEDIVRSEVKLPDALIIPADSQAPMYADGVSKPSAHGGTVDKPGGERVGLGASPELNRKGKSPSTDSAEPQKQPRKPLAPQSLPSAAPTPIAQDLRVDEPVPMDGDAALVDLHEVEKRLEKFLATYVRDYSRRDLERFMAHFAPAALENGTPLEDMQPLYEDNFRHISTIQYRIMVDSMSVGIDQVRFKGRFELKGLHADGKPILSRGKLNMDLEPFETTFRVRSLEYTFR